MMMYKDLKKNPNRNIKRFANSNFSEREIIQRPQIKTLNTLRGKSGEFWRKEGYWLHIPDKIMRDMGIRVTYSTMDIKVILVRKDV